MPHHHHHEHAAHDDRAGARQPKRFDPARAAVLDDRARLEYLPPAAILAMLDAPSGATVVDFGAGTGLYAEELARLRPDLRIVAVDEQPAMLDRLRDRARSGRFDVADPAGLEALAPDVQGVVAINVLHEIGDADLRRLFERLAPNAAFLFVDWDAAVTDRPGPPADHVYDAAEAVARLEALGLATSPPAQLRYQYAVLGRVNQHRPDGA